mmetsp:Transcript_44654/g.80077  ORF Transcript_44654/g.80077 Transcript_44654/m.80077 type:complete len:82 (-) Transcript_44654:651-896(-)
MNDSKMIDNDPDAELALKLAMLEEERATRISKVEATMKQSIAAVQTHAQAVLASFPQESREMKLSQFSASGGNLASMKIAK